MSVTEAELRKVIELPSDADVSSFIASAGVIRAEDLDASGMSSARLDLIELYLAAHFAALKYEHGALSRAEVGESAEEYQPLSRTRDGLSLSTYGQQAIALDTSGILASATTRLKAEFRVL